MPPDVSGAPAGDVSCVKVVGKELSEFREPEQAKWTQVKVPAFGALDRSTHNEQKKGGVLSQACASR